MHTAINLNVTPQMFFANIEYMKEQMEKILFKEKQLRPVSVVILSFVKVNDMDSTSLKEITELLEAWKNRELKVFIADAKGEVQNMVSEHLIGASCGAWGVFLVHSVSGWAEAHAKEIFPFGRN